MKLYVELIKRLNYNIHVKLVSLWIATETKAYQKLLLHIALSVDEKEN